MKPIRASQLEAAARPFVDAFVRALAEVQAKALNEIRDRALAAARATIDAELAGDPERTKAPQTRKRQHTTKPQEPIAPPPSTTAEAAPVRKPRQRAVVRCSNCHETGHNARSCERGAPSASDAEDEPRAREANHVVEERVIPHAELVAMLAADRARPGDAGGYVARADREPSLVGHTEEKREVCVVHGWVGRVAFERDSHAACFPVGEPCSNCRGTKVAGAGLCDHCDATGVEPPAPPAIAAVEPPASPDEVDPKPHNRRRDLMGYGSRAETIAPKRILKRELAEDAEDLAPELAELDALRPKKRADCVDGPRPCPWVSCKHHLALDINPETGSIKINFPDVEPWEIEQTCALDVADAGALTLEELGRVTNLTRERIRQLEVRGLHKLKATSLVRHGIGPEPFAEHGEHPLAEAEES